jgi:hypothetical protein
MIEISRTITDADRIVRWLEQAIRPRLTPDVSNYAQGRLRAWLNVEPTLTNPIRHLSGVDVDERYIRALQERVGFGFDYCLATYSGDGAAGVGIAPHRDASYANYEAYSVHLSGECRFDYWCGYPGYSYARDIPFYEVDRRSARVMRDGVPAEPTHRIVQQPGDVVHFNCKNPHAATPGPGRWSLNFWTRKPER